MPTILWSDGVRQKAPTWQALLDLIRESQPRKMTETQLRRELDRRARLWSGVRLDVSLPPGKLFRELEYAKMIVILDGERRAK